MKIKQLVGVVLTAVLILNLLPAVVPTAPAVAADAPAPSASSDVFGALGFDTSEMPEGYDPDSTENPFGKDLMTANEVFECWIDDPWGYRLAGHDAAITRADVGTGPRTTRSIGPFMLTLATGDFTGDGLAGEMVGVTFNWLDRPCLYFQSASGSRGAQKTLSSTTLTLNGSQFSYDEFHNYLAVTTGDYDGDGYSEVAVYVPEPGNARVDVYRLRRTGSMGESDWLLPGSWERAWSHAISAAPAPPNMVSLCSGDLNRDGTDDLAISWGAVEYLPATNPMPPNLHTEYTPQASQAVALFGSKTAMLQTQQTLTLGASPVVRAAFTFDDVNGDGGKELVMGAQPLSDAEANKQRTLGIYGFDGHQIGLTSYSTMNVVDPETAFDGQYLSLPILIADLAVMTPSDPASGGVPHVYLDSVLYDYVEGAFAIEAELDDPNVYGDGTGNPLAYAWASVSDRPPTFYWEYGAAAADVVGDGVDVLAANFGSRQNLPLTGMTDKRDAKILRGGAALTDVRLIDEEGQVGSHVEYTHAICFPNTDKNDTVRVRYTGEHFLKYTDPQVLAVIASPPYFGDIAENSNYMTYLDDLWTAFGTTEGSGDATLTTVSLNTGGWFETDSPTSKFRLQTGFAFDYEKERAETKEYSVTFNTPGGEDAVAFYSTPIEFWGYEALVPNESGGYDTVRTTVTMPRTAAVQVLNLDDYKAIQKEYSQLPSVDDSVLKHTLGDPATYPSSSSGYDVIAEYQRTDTGSWAGTGYGSGSVSQEINLAHEDTDKCLFGASFGLEAGGGAKVAGIGGMTGWFLDLSAQTGNSELDISGTQFGGSVKNFPAAEQEHGYYFAWKLFVHRANIDGHTFPVVDYLVKDVTAPPALPKDFAQDHALTTPSRVALDWTYDAPASYFQIYRYFDFPEGGGSYLIGTVPARDYTIRHGVDGTAHKVYTFADTGLSPYTEYLYQIQVVRPKAPPESAMSAVLAARTKTETGYPELSVSPSQLTVYPDKNAVLVASVRDLRPYVGETAHYQWQKLKGANWEDVDGATSAALVFSSASTKDAGAYRCRVNVITLDGNRAISAYTDTADVGYSKRSVLTDGIVTADTAAGTVISLNVRNAHADSGSIPSGKVEFVLRQRGANTEFHASANLDPTGKATATLGSLPDGLYETTAYYIGDRVFKDSSADPVQYLAGIGRGYWLDVPGSATYGDSVEYRVYRVTKDEFGSTSMTQLAGLTHEVWLAGAQGPYGGTAYDSPEPGGIYAGAAGDIVLHVHYDDQDVGEQGWLEAPISIAKRTLGLRIPTGSGGQGDAIRGMEPTVTSGTVAEAAPTFLADNVDYTYKNTAGTTVDDALVPGTPGHYDVSGAPSPALAANYDVTILPGSYAVIGATKKLAVSMRPFEGLYVGQLRTTSPFTVTTTGSDVATRSVTAGTKVILSTIPDGGYTVCEWYVNGHPQNKTTTTLAHTMLSEDTTIEVQLMVRPNTLTFGVVGAPGSGTMACTSDPGLTSGRVVKEGAPVSFTATPSAGYHFTEWRYSTEGSGTSYPGGVDGPNGSSSCTIVMPGRNASLSAVFERDSYTLTLSDHLQAVYWGDHDNDASTPLRQIIVTSGGKVPGSADVTIQPTPGYEADPDSAWLAIGSQGLPAEDNTFYRLVIEEDTEVRIPVIRRSYPVSFRLDDAWPSAETTITYRIEDPESSEVTTGTISRNATQSADLTVAGGAKLMVTAEVEYAYQLDHWLKAGPSSTATFSGENLDLGSVGETFTLTPMLAKKPTHSLGFGQPNIPSATYGYSVNGGAYVPASAESTFTGVIDGSEVTVRVTPPVGMLVAYWKIDGVRQQAFSNSYTFENVREDHRIEPVVASSSYCSVSWPECGADLNGMVVTPVDGYLPLVAPGRDFKFTVTPGIEGVQVGAVYANGLPLSAVDGVYTIPFLTASQVITVELADLGVKVDGADIRNLAGDGWRYDVRARVLTLSQYHEVSGAMVDPDVTFSLVLDGNVTGVTLNGLTMTASEVDAAIKSVSLQGVTVILRGNSRVELLQSASLPQQSVLSAIEATISCDSTGTLDLVADFPHSGGRPTSVSGVLTRSFVVDGGKVSITAANRLQSDEPFEVDGVKVTGPKGMRLYNGELDIQAYAWDEPDGIDVGEALLEVTYGQARITSRALTSWVADGSHGTAKGIRAGDFNLQGVGSVDIDVCASQWPVGIWLARLWNAYDQEPMETDSGLLQVRCSSPVANGWYHPSGVWAMEIWGGSSYWVPPTGVIVMHGNNAANLSPVGWLDGYLVAQQSGFNPTTYYLEVSGAHQTAYPASARYDAGWERDTAFSVTWPRHHETGELLAAVTGLTMDGTDISSTAGVSMDSSPSPAQVTLSAEYLAGLSHDTDHVMQVWFSNGQAAVDIPIRIDSDPAGTPSATLGIGYAEPDVFKGETLWLWAELSDLVGISGDAPITWELTGQTSAGTTIESADPQHASLHVAPGETASQLQVTARLSDYPGVGSVSTLINVHTVATGVTISPQAVTLTPLGGANTAQFTADVSALNGDPISNAVTWTVWGNTRRATRIGADGLLTVDPLETGYNGVLKVSAKTLAYPYVVSAMATVTLTPPDTTPPVTTDDHVAVYSRTATVQLNATDGGSGVSQTRYNLDASGWVVGSTVTTTAPGAHTLEYYSVDVAGNAEMPHRTIAFEVVAPTRYEETDPRIVYAGEWRTWKSSTYSGRSMVATTGAGTGYTFAFDGTEATIIAFKGPVYGQARVTIDGGTPELVNLYAPTIQPQQTVWSKSGLADTVHTVKVEWTGLKTGSGSYISLDAIEVMGTLTDAPVNPTRYEQTDPRIGFTGVWTTWTSSSYSGRTFVSATGAGSGYAFAFDGTAATIIAFKGPVYGQARVTIDGGTPELVNLYAPTIQPQQTVWSKSGLADTVHTVTVQWTGLKTGSGSYISLDAIDVVGALTP